VAQWLGRKQGETSEVTLAAYEYSTGSLRLFSEIGRRNRSTMSPPAQVAAWRDAAATKATPRTANNKLKIVRTLFQSAWRDGLLTENPAQGICPEK